MLQEIDIYFRVFFFIFGALIGSFLNVCIVRLPRNQSIVFPSSHCPQCKSKIAWFDNIPLLSFLWLRAKCRHCHKSIPFHYFMVELLTALLFLATYLSFGFSWVVVPAVVLVCGLIIATWVDLEWRIIPDEISLGGVFVGLFLSTLIPGLHKGPSHQVLWTGSAVACILVGTCFGLQLFKQWRRKLPFSNEDRDVYLTGTSLLILQGAALWVVLHVPLLAVSFSALADAFQGVIIGGCSLWVTGLLGEVIISKRIVTEFDFKGLVDDPLALLSDLRAHHYIDVQGNLQPAFRDVKSADNLMLSAIFEPHRKEIFAMIADVDEGGV
ncbi:MAG: prepilin peptidase, partial [Candidatus Omnitrophota bacterium]